MCLGSLLEGCAQEGGRIISLSAKVISHNHKVDVPVGGAVELFAIMPVLGAFKLEVFSGDSEDVTDAGVCKESSISSARPSRENQECERGDSGMEVC